MFRRVSAFTAAADRTEQPRSGALTLLLQLLLALAGGVLMALPWFDQALYWTAWVGGVPLLFALRGTHPRRALLLGWANGTAYFAIACYWIIEFLLNLRALSWPSALLCALLFWCYAGLSVGLAAGLYRFVSSRLPAWDLLSFPLCMAAVMGVYPLLFGAYYAEAQARFLPALQGISLFGVQALNLLMLMTGVLIFQLLTDRCRAQRSARLVAAAVLGAWFTYGFAALYQWDRRMQSWELRTIGLVQPNDAVTLEVPEPAPGFTREHPEEMAATLRLAAAGAELVIWPEARYKGYFDRYSVRMSYARLLHEHGVDLIMHDVERAWADGEAVHYNSLLHLDASGTQRGVYRKMRLMPFGEYLPRFFHLPGVDWLSRTFFGEFLRPLQPGLEHEIFAVKGMRVVPKICYETAFPEFIAGAVGADAAGKVLLFVSQDNWFGETTQPFQHSAMSVVRAVENRVPMIHLINNGPSVVAAPNGRLTDRSQAFAQQELLAMMPYSAESGGSFYSRHPQLLPSMLYSGAAVLVILAFRRRPAGQTN